MFGIESNDPSLRTSYLALYDGHKSNERTSGKGNPAGTKRNALRSKLLVSEKMLEFARSITDEEENYTPVLTLQ